MGAAIERFTALRPSGRHYAGWLGVNCRDIHAAIWMMRALIAVNVLSRREDTILFVPVNPSGDPEGEIVVQALIRIHGFASTRNLF